MPSAASTSSPVGDSITVTSSVVSFEEGIALKVTVAFPTFLAFMWNSPAVLPKLTVTASEELTAVTSRSEVLAGLYWMYTFSNIPGVIIKELGVTAILCSGTAFCAPTVTSQVFPEDIPVISEAVA